ncbi:hypothetical protein B0H19DRAFT_1068986 [Mycena capillaripes]|nr:hypothetical protein B0H19DRAFT_1068986 [Mycena capillaripes]
MTTQKTVIDVPTAVIDVPTVVLTIPALRAQVLASPSGEILLAIPSGALVLRNLCALPPDLAPIPALPSADKAPVLRTTEAPYIPLADRSACTLQLDGLRVPNRQCHCVIPCVRLKPLFRAVDLPPSPIRAELHLHGARVTDFGVTVIFRTKR